MKNKYLYIVFVIVCISFSCSFNKIFLQPQKGSLKPVQIKSDIPDKKLVLKFDSKNYQPFILANGFDTLEFDTPIESFIFRKLDGTALNGWLLKPQDSKPKATIINLHGNSGNLFTQFATLRPLVKRGFQIFMFDYSGFGFSEGKATRKNTISDACTAIEYALTRLDIKNTPVVIYGQSYGGHLAAAIANQFEDRIAGLIIEGAFTSPKSIASHRAGFIGRLFTKTVFCGIDSISKFKTKPLLIIHSKEDKTIPFRMAENYFSRANNSKELFSVTGPHLSAPTLVADEISAKISAMLLK